MKIKKVAIYGDCLEAIGIPQKGFAVIDREEKPRPFDVVWCNNPVGTATGYLKQIVQTGGKAIVRTRYIDRERDYQFYAPEVYGVVLRVEDEKQNVVWERPKKTNADHIRSMSDEELARFIANELPEDINDWEDLMLKWLQQPARFR